MSSTVARASGFELQLPPRCIVVMGVSGCGKSSVGRALAEALGLAYLEGDELHTEANVRKMASGTPLTDADRAGWLDALAQRLASARSTPSGDSAGTSGAGLVLACSALKRAYRDRLRQAAPDLRLVHLHGEADLLAQRMAQRQGHYMPASLLPSQLATLEPPSPDEHALVLDIAQPLDQLVAAALQHLQIPNPEPTA